MGRNLLRYGLIACYGLKHGQIIASENGEGGKKMMSVDENVIFREAPLRLSSSLDIETALKRCYKYIRTFIPVKRMGLDIVDLEENILRYMVHEHHRKSAWYQFGIRCRRHGHLQ
jgi:hypothetical protein